MQEARSSWNTIFLSKEGFECQITLRDDDEVKLVRRAEELLEFIEKSGGVPLRRRYFFPEENKTASEEENTKPERREKTYIDEGKVLICNLSKGKVGEDASSLLGAMMVTKLQLAALSRADLPEEKRRPFYLYVDEIHSFLTLSFADILSEARKYGLNLILAHQYIDQLDEKIKEAIFGNVGTIISFRVGAEDAKYLAREFYPVFNERDLVSLPNYHIYLKLMVNGVTSRPFSAVTLPPPEKERSYKREITELSRKRYARPRKEVEKEILFHPENGQYSLI